MSRIIVLFPKTRESYEVSGDFCSDNAHSQQAFTFSEGYEGPRSAAPAAERHSFWSDVWAMLRRMFCSGPEPTRPTVPPMRVQSADQVGEAARELEAAIRRSPYAGFEESKGIIRQWIERYIASAAAVDSGNAGALRGVDPEVLRQAARYLQSRAQTSDDGAVGRNVREAAQEYAARLDALADNL